MVHNFNAGPSILPKEVFQQASEAILNFNNTGLSLLEIGHRTPLFEAVVEEAVSLMKELMGLTQGQEVLFLHGGASTQFMQIPMNLLPQDGLAAYTETGTWSNKAIKEAKQFGEVYIAGSGKEFQYNRLPEVLDIPANCRYLHLTSNETIAGTQWHQFPYECGVPLVADMSSDILSRTLDFNQFDLIYAGAQKNIGAAGVNITILKPELLGKTNRKIPTMLDYQQHIDNKSMLNTPPVFAIYVCLLTLRWLKAQGGVAAIEKINDQKANLLYDTLDALPIFKPTVAKEDRSKMNVVFVLENQEMEAAFQQLCKAEGMIGIKGHRSVGGFRVSLYNALPLSSVEAFTQLMHYFVQKKG